MTDIEMKVPAAPRHVRPVRLVAASLATDLGFDWERIEDVKVAVDELCSLYRSDNGSIELTFAIGDDGLEIRGHYLGDGEIAEPDWLVLEILQATTDDIELPTTETGRFRFVCRPTENAPA